MDAFGPSFRSRCTSCQVAAKPARRCRCTTRRRSHGALSSGAYGAQAPVSPDGFDFGPTLSMASPPLSVAGLDVGSWDGLEIRPTTDRPSTPDPPGYSSNGLIFISPRSFVSPGLTVTPVPASPSGWRKYIPLKRP